MLKLKDTDNKPYYLIPLPRSQELTDQLDTGKLSITPAMLLGEEAAADAKLIVAYLDMAPSPQGSEWQTRQLDLKVEGDEIIVPVNAHTNGPRQHILAIGEQLTITAEDKTDDEKPKTVTIFATNLRTQRKAPGLLKIIRTIRKQGY